MEGKGETNVAREMLLQIDIFTTFYVYSLFWPENILFVG